MVHVRLIEAAMRKDLWAPVLQNLITAGCSGSKTTGRSRFDMPLVRLHLREQ